MKIMRVVCVSGICCLKGVCFARESEKQWSPEVELNLSLYPQKNKLNLPTLGTDTNTAGSARVSVGFVARTLRNGYNFSSNSDAPVFVRVSPHAISIRLEWKFK